MSETFMEEVNPIVNAKNDFENQVVSEIIAFFELSELPRTKSIFFQLNSTPQTESSRLNLWCKK